MITPQEALALILEHAAPLPPESVPLAEAAGRVLAEPLVCREDLPPFDVSAMDGYAVRTEDCRAAADNAPAALTSAALIKAGHRGGVTLGARQAARIMTGAPVPAGADAVIMQEVVEAAEDGLIRIARPPRRGQHIRLRGEDARAGTTLLEPGTRLRPYEIALLASQGAAAVSVLSRPTARVVVTGDELLDASQPPAPGRIRDSNGPALAACLQRWGCLVSRAAAAADAPAALERALGAALAGCDLLLVTGGVSVGDADFTKDVLERLGVRRLFWRVAIKPGKPLYFGVLGRKLVFGLPGNPVAALVCAEEFVRPAVERLQGLRPAHDSYHLRGTALNDYPKPADRQQYLFCRARRSEAGYELQILRPQGSAMLAMTSRANALAVGPLGAARVKTGDCLAFRWLK